MILFMIIKYFSGWNIKIVSTLDTTKYLEDNYGDCGVLGDYKSEVLSLVEQEIAYRGDYLLFSELSGSKLLF